MSSNKITIILQAKVDDAKKNIASLQKDIKSATTSIDAQVEAQKTHSKAITDALNKQNTEYKNFAEKRKKIVDDAIFDNQRLTESMKSKANPFKDQLDILEQARAKMKKTQETFNFLLKGGTLSDEGTGLVENKLKQNEKLLSEHNKNIKRMEWCYV